MKSITNRIVLFAATAAFLGALAYGQVNNVMKAGIPFGFTIPTGGATAGNYIVVMENIGSGKVVRLYNSDTQKSVLALANGPSPVAPGDAQPRLVFRCGAESGCALSEIWTGNAGYSVNTGKARKYEYLASIPLRIEQGN